MFYNQIYNFGICDYAFTLFETTLNNKIYRQFHSKLQFEFKLIYIHIKFSWKKMNGYLLNYVYIFFQHKIVGNILGTT